MEMISHRKQYFSIFEDKFGQHLIQNHIHYLSYQAMKFSRAIKSS